MRLRRRLGDAAAYRMQAVPPETGLTLPDSYQPAPALR
jgi:hypothetical protein